MRDGVNNFQVLSLENFTSHKKLQTLMLWLDDSEDLNVRFTSKSKF
jgi:hypothetical protein